MNKQELEEALATAERRLASAQKNEGYWFKRSKRSNAERAALEDRLDTLLEDYARLETALQLKTGEVERLTEEVSWRKHWKAAYYRSLAIQKLLESELDEIQRLADFGGSINSADLRNIRAQFDAERKEHYDETLD